MTRDEIYLFHMTGLPLHYIKHSLQVCDSIHDALEYLKNNYGTNRIS